MRDEPPARLEGPARRERASETDHGTDAGEATVGLGAHVPAFLLRSTGVKPRK